MVLHWVFFTHPIGGAASKQWGSGVERRIYLVNERENEWAPFSLIDAAWGRLPVVCLPQRSNSGRKVLRADVALSYMSLLADPPRDM